MERTLSDDGRRDASLLGASLPAPRELRLWHSPVPRCRQTAEACLEGYLTAHPAVDARIEGPDPRLESWSTLGLDPQARRNLLANSGGAMGFLRAWLDDLVPAGALDRSANVSHDVAGSILDRLRVADPGALQLYISHDFTLFAVRAHIFRPRLEDMARPEYLDGIVFEMDAGGRCIARWRDLTNVVGGPPGPAPTGEST